MADVPQLIAGVDEAGRGPLAGPVVAAAVILSPSDPLRGNYRDSKKLGEKKRRRLYHHIRATSLACAVAAASVDEIDRLNILQATLRAMQRAVEALDPHPHKVLVDGDRLPILEFPAIAVVGGDDRIQEIAAASIVAKVVRDRLMRRLHFYFPEYGFDVHKGYATRAHLKALACFGACAWHRRSFAPVQRALERKA